MSSPKGLSVVMLSHNSERTIKSAVFTALKAMKQDDCELLVFDDGSNDSTVALLGQIRDKRLVVLKSERVGLHNARTLSISASRYESIAIMDSDDIALPWRFSFPMNQLSTYSAVYGSALVFGSALRPLQIMPQWPIHLQGADLAKALVIANPLVHSSSTFRRSLYLEVGGYGYATSEDYELWLRMASVDHERMVRFRTPLVAYRFHSSQYSAKCDFESDVEADQTLKSLRKELALKLGFPSAQSLDLKNIRSSLYSQVPFMRYEHAGLPRWMRGKP